MAQHDLLLGESGRRVRARVGNRDGSNGHPFLLFVHTIHISLICLN